jgi:hypothetical protein
VSENAFVAPYQFALRLQLRRAVVEVEVHLAGIGVSEFSEFQVHNDEAS